MPKSTSKNTASEIPKPATPIIGVGEVVNYRDSWRIFRIITEFVEGYQFLGDLKNFPQGEFINAHGVFGSIIKIDGNTIIAKAKDDVEKTILVSDSTIIQKGRKKVKLPDLKVDEDIVVIGSPNEEGQIEAKLIRVFDGSDPRGLPYRPSRSVPFN